jgi:hypothetical protein
MTSLDWMLIDIPEKWHEALTIGGALQGYVHDMEKGKHKSRVSGRKAVVIHEFVSECLFVLAVN